jgi:hypothetical protein
VKVIAGLYHGSEALCALQETEEILVQDGSCKVQKDLTLPLQVCDIPRCARLCFTLRSTNSAKKRNTRVSWNGYFGQNA